MRGPCGSVIRLKLHGVWLLLVLANYGCFQAEAQQAVQFLPDDVPTIASKLTSRLVYRASGFRQFWKDRYVTDVFLQNRIVQDPAAWRQDFNETGGVAVLGPATSNGGNFTISSDGAVPESGDVPAGSQQQGMQELNFSQMPNAMLVLGGGLLTFHRVLINDIAPVQSYNYSSWQPWRNAAIGYPLWPTITLGPNATVQLVDAGVNYEDPSHIDTCEQYNAKVVFGLRQQWGRGNVTEVNATASRIEGPLTIPVLVLNGSTNSTDNSTGEARAFFHNVTFNCLVWQNETGGGLGPAAHTAAIVVPVVVGLMLAGLAAWLLLRRRRKQHRGWARAASAKDLEAGRQGNTQRFLQDNDLDNARDQQGGLWGRAPDRAPAGTAIMTGPSSSAHTSSSSTPAGASSATGTHSTATPNSLHTPVPIGTAGRPAAGMASSSEESNYASYVVQGTTAAPTTGPAAGVLMHQLQPPPLSPTSSGLWHSTSRSATDSAGNLQLVETSSLEMTGLERVSTGRLSPAVQKQQQPVALAAAAAAAAVGAGETASARQSLDQPAHAAVAAGRRSTESQPSEAVVQRYSLDWGSQGAGAAGTADTMPGIVSLSARQSVDSAAAADSTAGGSAAGSTAAGSTRGSGGGGGAGSGSTADHAGTSSAAGSRSTLGSSGDRIRGVPALLKARSDMAVLRDLKIGPLLGRGSYGRVYKGRWKAVTVAVKIIEHQEGSPGAASSNGKRISIGNETLLATAISHPNVVQTYHISTMSIAQRNALASSWITETAGGGSSSGLAAKVAASMHEVLGPSRPARTGEEPDVDVEGSEDSSTTQSSMEEQRDVLETWILMEFCEKGSLERAMSQGRFTRKEDHQPEMIGIYKALLDTASGLDYLHSIGVVHGDLKTANVLLKGSTRDVRGFACKITDFGLSRVLDMDATHVSTRTYGTIVYMPSELLLTGRLTTATDIYSFGLMMWELFCSQRVFEEGLSIGQIFYMIAYQGWRPAVPPNCPPGYAQLMTACWHQDPEQRPTVQQLLRSLQRLYVAEKQRMTAARGLADGPGAMSAAAAAAATPAGHQPGSYAPLQGAEPGPIRSVAAGRLSASLFAAAAAAADSRSGSVQAQSPVAAVMPVAASSSATGTKGSSEEQSGTPNRISVDSTGSDRYQNAAAAAPRLQQWTYPGQVRAPPASQQAGRGATADSPASVAGEDSSNRNEAPAATATATALTAAVLPAATAAATASPFAGSSAGGPVGGDGSGRARGSSETAGSGAAATGSGGTDVHDEYQSWAHAVTRQGSGLLQDSTVAKRQQSFAHAAATAAAAGSVPLAAVMQPQQVRLQQQSPFSPQTAPAPALGVLGNRVLHNTEIEPLDNEPMPSESLFQHVSSGSNAVYGNPEDTGEETGYFLSVHPAATYGRSQQLQQREGLPPGGAAAAAGFLEAIEMAARPGASSSAAAAYDYQQPRQVMPMQPSVASSFPDWGSVSTGTMPSVLADSSSLAYMPSSSTLASIVHSSSPQPPLWASSDGPAGGGPPGCGAVSGEASCQPNLHSPFATYQASPAAAAAAAAVPLATPTAAPATPSTRPAARHAMGPGQAAAAAAVNLLGSMPERNPFIYRTPSGRVIIPPSSLGLLQTVRENSRSNSGSSRAGSGRRSSGAESLVGSTAHSPEQQHVLQQQLSRERAAAAAPPEPSSSQPQPTEEQQQQQQQQQQHQHQQRPSVPVRPPPSPFAALAHRAGSLFGPA